jgi:hypothetical protein
MGLETASFISSLNSSWPLGTDSGTFGDNHLRLIKSVLKGTFPGSTGNGFNKQIVATEDEINHLTGLTVNINSALNTAKFPAGTVIPFYNATPPTGWSLVTLSTSYMLIAGSVAGASTGGADSPLLNDKVPSHTHTTTGATTSPSGSHSHTFSPTSVAAFAVGGAGKISGAAESISLQTPSITAAGDHTHDLSGLTIANNAGAANWAPRYLGMILCSKD